MAALREIFASFGIEFDKSKSLEKGDRAVKKTTKDLAKLEKQTKENTKENKKFERSTKDSSRAVGMLSSAISGAAIVAGFRSLVSSTVESTNELFRWSQNLGISQEEMYGWAQTAALFGGSIDDITDVLKELQLKAGDAASGNQSMIDAFKRVGLEVDDLRPIMDDQTALLERFTTAMANTTSETQRNLAVDELMSDAGTRLNGMFRAGTKEITRLRRGFQETGGRDLPRLSEATRRYTLAQRALGVEWTQARNLFVLKFLPALTKGLATVQGWIKAFSDWTEDSNNVRIAIALVGTAAVAAGIAASAAWGPAIVAMASIGVAVAAVALIIEDLYVTVGGGDSVTRQFLNWALGAETATAAINTLGDAITALGNLGEGIEEALFGSGGLFGPEQQRRGVGVGGMSTESVGRGVRPSAVAPEVTADEEEQRYLRDLGLLGPARGSLEVGIQNQRAIEQSITPENFQLQRQEDLQRRLQDLRMQPGVFMGRGPQFPQSVQPSQSTVNVDAPATVSVIVNEATDAPAVAREVERAVTRGIREERASLARGLSTLRSDNEIVAQGES